MKQDNHAVSIWLLVGGAVLCFLLIMIAGNIIVIGEKIGRIHPASEMAFYLLILVLGFVFFVRPVMSVLKAPVIPIHTFVSHNDLADAPTCRRIAKTMIKRARLTTAERERLQTALRQDGDLHEPLRALFAQRVQDMNTIISKNAKLVFVSTAISQNGRLDAVMVIGTNIRLVRELVESLGFRPALPQLVKMYTSIAAAALLAEGLEDLELEQVFPNLGMGVLGAIPGFQLITASLLQGMANAFLTLRVGVMTKNYLIAAGQDFKRKEARRAANREAVRMLKPVMKEGLVSMPVSLKEAWVRFF